MAEIVGAVASGVTLAALFKLCIDAFDGIQTIKKQALDLQKLVLKLNIQKCRLYIWGKAMGLTSMGEPVHDMTLDRCPYPELVLEILKLILDMLKDSDKLEGKYGCVTVEDVDVTLATVHSNQSHVLQQFSASFDHFRISSTPQVRPSPLAKKVCWAIRDRKKFETLIHEAKALIDGLQDITKHLCRPAVQQETISSRISRINDVRTLDWVCEVCEIDYPSFSDAASSKAETISQLSSFHRDIQNWKDTVESHDEGSDASSVDTMIAGLETMTVTELKHSFSTYLLRAKEARLERREVEKRENRQDSLANLQENSTFRTTTEQLSLEVKEYEKNKLTAEAEVRINEDILAGMAKAATDKPFMQEQDAVTQWFEVLSAAEQLVHFYKMGEALSGDLDKTRFLARIQSYRLDCVSRRTTIIESTDLPGSSSNDALVVSSKTKEAVKQTVQPSPTINTPQIVRKRSLETSDFARDPDMEKKVSNHFSEFARAQKATISEGIISQQQAERMRMIEGLKGFAQELQLWPTFRTQDVLIPA